MDTVTLLALALAVTIGFFFLLSIFLVCVAYLLPSRKAKPIKPSEKTEKGVSVTNHYFNSLVCYLINKGLIYDRNRDVNIRRRAMMSEMERELSTMYECECMVEVTDGRKNHNQ